MVNEKRLTYVEDVIDLFEKDIAESKDALKNAYYGDKEAIRGEMNGIRAAISILKHHASHGGTVNAVEVVRCKECKHCLRHTVPLGEYGYCNHFGYYNYAPEVQADDFCSYGERREGE